MFCEKCGAKIEDGSLFCEKCGAKMEYEEVTTEQTVQANMEDQTAAQPTQPVMNQPYMAQTPVMNQPYIAPQPKAPMSKGKKMLIIELVLLAIIAVVFYKVGTKQYSAEKAADNYFKAEAAGDWEAVYEMMDIPESPLMTTELFVDTMQNTKVRDVTNYTVKENENMFDEEKDFVKTFTCEFVVKGQSGTSSEYINVVKQQKKKWLIFDEWKVSPSESIVEDFTIYMPVDATATIAGIDLKELDTNASKEDNYLEYTLPQMFAGTYELIVNAPYRQEYTDSINVDGYSNGYSVNNMQVESNILETLEPICTEFIGKYYESALAETTYDQFVESVGDAVSPNYNDQGAYEDLVYSLNNYGEITKLNIDSVEYEFNGQGQSNDGNLLVYVNATIQTSRDGYTIRTNWWTGDETKEPYTNEQQERYKNFALELVDGQWKVLQ